MKVKNYFPQWIGQASAIRYLNEVLTVVESGELIPLQPLFLEGFAGLGKTRLAKALAKVAESMGFGFVEITSSITLPAFLQLWGNLIEGKRVIVFIDECAQLIKNKKVSNLLKRILETQKSVMPIATDTGHITADPFQHWFVFASNEEPKDSALFGPCSRTRPLLLLPYTHEEKQAIIGQMCDKWGFKIDKDATEFLAGRVMANGRAISELVENEALIYSKLSGGKIDLASAKELVERSGRFPQGLRLVDMRTLLFLQTEPKGRQVSELAMLCGGEAPQTTGDRLRALAGIGLVITLGNGRKALTDAGVTYLREFKAAQDAAKGKANGAKTNGKEAPKAKAPEVKEAPKGKTTTTKAPKEAKALKGKEAKG